MFSTGENITAMAEHVVLRILDEHESLKIGWTRTLIDKKEDWVFSDLQLSIIYGPTKCPVLPFRLLASSAEISPLSLRSE